MPAFAPSSPPPAPPRKPRVLVIDDELFMHRVLRAMLSDCIVEADSSAAIALARLTGGERFDLIICDLNLGQGMSGLEFYEELSAAAPATAQRVLFLTGGALDATTEAFVHRMADRVLAKPLELPAFRAAVKAALERGS